MGDKTNPTKYSAVNNNCHLGYNEHGSKSKIGVDDTHPIYTSPFNILVNRKEWPSGSVRFFIRDHKNQGDGLRGLVFNSVVDSKTSSDFSSLTVHDMFFHLHIASIHYGISTTKSITTMMLHNSSEHNQLIESERNVLPDSYHNSIVQLLTAPGILKVTA